MVLDLKGVFAGGEGFAFDFGMDMGGFEAAPGEHPFREPVRVSGQIVNRAGLVTVSATAVYDYHAQCDRCLKEICQHETVSIENTLAREIAGEPDNDIIVCEDETLDMDELAVTNVILNLSMKHLCREDCRGLCPKCGKNLNEGDCGCGGEDSDPRFAKLKDLIH